MFLNKILVLTLVSVFSEFCLATHFRGGTLSASPSSIAGSTVTMNFQAQLSWRLTFSSETYCDSNTIQKLTPYGITKDDFICTVGCKKPKEVLSNGGSMNCKSFSSSENWSTGQKSFKYDFDLNGEYSVNYQGSAWIELNTANGSKISNQPWDLKYTFNTFIRSDTGKINQSPIAIIDPVYRVILGYNVTLRIPHYDMDGDTTRCRWSSAALNECGGVCGTLPSLILNPECYLSFYTASVLPGWYVVTIQLEDFANANDTKPLSSVPIQFLIEVIDSNPQCSCTTNPSIYSNRTSKSCVRINQLFQETFYAGVNCPDDEITIINATGPNGISTSNLFYSNSSNLWYANVIWNPALSQTTTNTICVTALDELLLKATNCFTLIFINDTFTTSTKYPSNIIDLSLAVNQPMMSANELIFVLTYSIDVILKPTSTAYIHIIQYDTNNEIYEIDTSKSQDVEIVNNMLIFTVPLNLIQVDLWYYMTFDYGVVLANDSCYTPSDPIMNSTFWKFKVINCLSTSTNSIPACNKSSFLLILFMLILVYLIILLIILIIVAKCTIKRLKID